MSLDSGAFIPPTQNEWNVSPWVQDIRRKTLASRSQGDREEITRRSREDLKGAFEENRRVLCSRSSSYRGLRICRDPRELCEQVDGFILRSLHTTGEEPELGAIPRGSLNDSRSFLLSVHTSMLFESSSHSAPTHPWKARTDSLLMCELRSEYVFLHCDAVCMHRFPMPIVNARVTRSDTSHPQPTFSPFTRPRGLMHSECSFTGTFLLL